ncbi:MAG: GGDEF domain-containing protein, partial [Oscillospiraceae bacterium]
MKNKLKNLLGFPYPKEYEAGFNRSLMKSMHKPLLIAVVATLIFVTWLVGLCIFAPQDMGPAQYVRGLLRIHFAFMLFTMLVLLIVVAFRRQLFQYPRLHVVICNAYAIGVCVWASALSAYAHYSVAIYIAFIVVTLCVSMVSLFKPWMAVVVFSANYALYFLLSRLFLPGATDESTAQLYSGALAAILGMIIAIAFYRFRTRTYYDRLVIARQLDEINEINHQLQQLVHIDNLTGLFNRRFYDEKLSDLLKDMTRTSGICCFMADI